jgi:hypothetical protein
MATTQVDRIFPAATRQTPRARLAVVTAAPELSPAPPRGSTWALATQAAGGAAALATSAALWAWFLAATW